MIEAIFVLSVIVWLACQRQQGHLVQRRPSYIIRDMSKTLLSVMIEELETIRLICQNPDCRCVAEFKASKLEGAPYFQCQFCGVVFTEPVVNEARLAKSDGEFDGLGWYFYDEAYLTHGPFESKELAEQIFAKYLEHLMGGDINE